MLLFLVYESVPECPARIRGIFMSRSSAEACIAAIERAEDPYWNVRLVEIQGDTALDVSLGFARKRLQAVAD